MMTLVPLPDIPTLRIGLTFKDALGNLSGTRFYLSYSGSAPTGANCNTLATDIHGDWVGNLQQLTSTGISLIEVDVLDIATYTGNSGLDTSVSTGIYTGTPMPIQIAMNIGYNIARRYRGGKPRGYWPFGSETSLQDQSNFTGAFVNSVNIDFPLFMTAVQGHSVGSVGVLQHINLHRFAGFSNHTNTSGRTDAVPTYITPNAKHDVVTGYKVNQLLSSQRRRRKATTP